MDGTEATPSNDMNMEARMSFCVHCRQPIVSINMGSDEQPNYSPWQHAFSGQPQCEARVPEAPPTERTN